jgi:hypothetical protein
MTAASAPFAFRARLADWIERPRVQHALIALIVGDPGH